MTARRDSAIPYAWLRWRRALSARAASDDTARACGGTLGAVRLFGKQVVLRKGEPQQASRLTSIANEPEVAAWWEHTDGVEVAAQFVDKETSFIITYDGEVIGAIQYDEEDNGMCQRAGIDIFLTTSRHGQGLATDAIRALVRHLFEEVGHHRLTIDPAVDNERAILAYEAVGFRRVGVMREYERGADGSWLDGLLALT
jgi:aminoglycoside 6'-N-acetyltransferase